MTRRAIALAALLVLAAAPALAVSPGKRHERTPERLKLGYEAVRFAAPDSVRLSGWWFPAAPATHAVVLAPRGEGTMANLLEAVKAFHDRGFSVLTFDYRDFGPGGPGSQDSLRYVVLASRWVSDMVGALGYARTRVSPEARVLVWGGHDVSSAVAIAAAARDRRNCDALAIEGFYRSTDEIMRLNGTAVIPDAVRQQKGKVLFRDEAAAAASRLKVPVLVVMGARDSLMPPATTMELLASSRTRRDRLLIPQGGHADLEQSPEYFDRVAAWFLRMAQVPREEPEP